MMEPEVMGNGLRHLLAGISAIKRHWPLALLGDYSGAQNLLLSSLLWVWHSLLGVIGPTMVVGRL